MNGTDNIDIAIKWPVFDKPDVTSFDVHNQNIVRFAFAIVRSRVEYEQPNNYKRNKNLRRRFSLEHVSATGLIVHTPTTALMPERMRVHLDERRNC